MECPKCKIVDMRVDRVEEGVIYYICPKCKEEQTLNSSQLEEDE